MSLPRLEEPSLLADRVFGAIRAGIMSGEIPAGARLRIRDLAAQLGTSVMPVREAIRRLEESGLAERQPHKGAVVKVLTLSELVHVYDVRLLLESEAARLGAARIEPSDVEAMAGCLHQMRAAIGAHEVVQLLDHDEAFLSILYTASGNPVLVTAVRTLWERCRSYKILGATATLASDDQSPLWVFQERLLAALRSSDAEMAGEISRESLHSATARIRQQLADEGLAADGALGSSDLRACRDSNPKPSDP